MHLRRQYLESLQTQLKAGGQFAGVWIQRGRRKQTKSYPNITLYAQDEIVRTETDGRYDITPSPRPQTRTLTVAVRCWLTQSAEDAEKVERDFDKFSETIEQTLTNTFGAIDFMLIATDFDAHETDGDEPFVHSVTLTYQIIYYTQEQTPTL